MARVKQQAEMPYFHCEDLQNIIMKTNGITRLLK